METEETEEEIELKKRLMDLEYAQRTRSMGPTIARGGKRSYLIDVALRKLLRGYKILRLINILLVLFSGTVTLVLLEIYNPGITPTYSREIRGIVEFVSFGNVKLTQIGGYYPQPFDPWPQQVPDTVRQYRPEIEFYAQQKGLDPLMVATIMTIESCGGVNAESYVGAKGLMQVMPYHFDDGEDMFDPDTNIDTGTDVLRDFIRITIDDESAMVAYNSGNTFLEVLEDGTRYLNKNEVSGEAERYLQWSQIYFEWDEYGYSPTYLEWLDAGGEHLCKEAKKGMDPLALESELDLIAIALDTARGFRFEDYSEELVFGRVTPDTPPTAVITIGFYERYPWNGEIHTGTDIARCGNPEDWEAISPVDGYVLYTSHDRFRGGLIAIQPTDRPDVLIEIWHLEHSSIPWKYRRDQSPYRYVSKGDFIGYAGIAKDPNSGGTASTGPHLHVELTIDGILEDFMDYSEDSYSVVC